MTNWFSRWRLLVALCIIFLARGAMAEVPTASDGGTAEEIDALLAKANIFYQQEDFDQAAALYDEIERRHGRDKRAAVRARVLTALCDKTLVLIKTRKWEAEEALWKNIWKRFGQEKDAEIRVRLAQALFKRVYLSFRYDGATAVATINRMFEHFGKDQDPDVRSLLAAALSFKGVAIVWRHSLATQGDWHKEATAVFWEVNRRFGKDQNPETRYWVARALMELVNVDPFQALEVSRVLDEQFSGKAEWPATRALVIQGLLASIGHESADTGAVVDGDVIYADIERRFGDETDEAMRAMLVTALLDKSRRQTSDDPEKAIAVYDEILRRFGEDAPLEIREKVAHALMMKARALMMKADALPLSSYAGERLALYDEILRRYREEESPAIAEILADAQTGRNQLLIDQGKIDSADALLVDIERAQGDEKASRRLAESLRVSARAMMEQDMLEALALYQAMKERLTQDVMVEDQAFALKIELVRALGAKTAMLAVKGDAAESAFEQEIEARFGRESEAINALLLEILLFKGWMLAAEMPDKPQLAIAAFQQIIERAGENKDMLQSARKAVETLSSSAWPTNREEFLREYYNLSGGD